MALFEYKAVTPSGETLTGEMDAPSKALVIAHLQEAGNIPVSAREVGTGFRLSTLFRGRRGLKQSEVGDLTQQLSTLLGAGLALEDRKSTRLNSSHVAISYAVFCLKKKKTRTHEEPRTN